jgi:glycosyl transferase family 87
MGGGVARSLLRRPVPAGLAMASGFALMAIPGADTAARVAIQAGLFAIFVAVLFDHSRRPLEPRELRAALGFALLFRLCLLFAPPFYSDDLYRYLWDGRVQTELHRNPYLHAPAEEPEVPFREELLPRINHPDVPTVYPPVSEMLFALIARIGPSAIAVKGILVICDLLLTGVLLRLLRRLGLPDAQVLIYAWNPLVVAEVAGNGHVDVLAILLLVTGIHLIIVERSVLSTIALGLSTGAKFLPVLTFPILARRVPRRFWMVPFLVLASVYVPYAGAGEALFRGLKEYAERWQHNDCLFSLLLGGAEFLNPTPVLKAGIGWLHGALGYPSWIVPLYTYAYPVYLARMAAFLLAASLAAVLTRKKADPIRGTFLLVGAILLLSPTAHPWYFLWIAPLLALRPSRAWILLTGLLPLSYLDPGPVMGGIPGRPWVRWTEYLPFFALLLADAVISYRRRDPVTLFGLGQFPPGRSGSWPGEKTRAGKIPPLQ